MEIDRRQQPRTKVDLPCVAIFQGKGHLAQLIDVSQGGCLIEAPILPKAADLLLVRFGKETLLEGFQGQVRWMTPGQAMKKIGLCFWEMEEGKKAKFVEDAIRLDRRLRRIRENPVPEISGINGILPADLSDLINRHGKS